MNGNELQGMVAWVVGGSGAIGSVIASTLAAEGARIWVSGRDTAKLAKVVADIADARGEAQSLVLASSATDPFPAATERILRESGRINILVNCTASSISGDFLRLQDEQWLAVFESKLLTYVRAMRACLPVMAEAGGGVVVNVSGRGGRLPSATHLAGGSMNAAVNLLSKGLADAWQSRGVRINVVAPGPIVSERFRLLNQVASDAGMAMAAGTSGTPKDVAEAVLWLVSDRSRHVRGSVMQVDGGSLPTV